MIVLDAGDRACTGMCDLDRRLDFFGTGVAVWTTNRIEIFLTAQELEMNPGDAP
jgi:hypothetical protein